MILKLVRVDFETPKYIDKIKVLYLTTQFKMFINSPTPAITDRGSLAGIMCAALISKLLTNTLPFEIEMEEAAAFEEAVVAFSTVRLVLFIMLERTTTEVAALVVESCVR